VSTSSAVTAIPVARNIDAEIQRVGKTNNAIAMALNVSEPVVWRWRKGKVTPSWASLCEIAEFFGREPGWFYLDHDRAEAA
jgi:transcriptional regulator with XRE-family HTH domain